MGRLVLGGRGGIRLALLLMAVVVLAGGCGEPETESASPVSQTDPGRTSPTSTVLAGPGESVVEPAPSSAQQLGITELPPEMPEDFWFAGFSTTDSTWAIEVRPQGGSWEASYRHEGSYAEWATGAQEQTATLSREEVQAVYERLQAIDFLQYPVEPGPSPEPAATDPQSPEDIEDLEAFVLSAGWGQVEHGVRWWGGPEADRAELEPLRETLAQIEQLAREKFE